ncbi:hypothetical protein PF007_g26919 [Phytophthora fragariae]|uniref:Uncharacterized protein n=1 Tax=Phytophthora fragariae TaxID=53985 RepID=A0A6A3PNE8_9STRA|nr:hypothetical protein PF006_g32292 [Phytophthora fragariae]KAE9070507.1 hypothetical protein PF007_g26919 [Phytophthora fragariae]KAE9261242.1 hypothetical protein PF001_g32472 [Phytophthora fragariae]
MACYSRTNYSFGRLEAACQTTRLGAGAGRPAVQTKASSTPSRAHDQVRRGSATGPWHGGTADRQRLGSVEGKEAR